MATSIAEMPTITAEKIRRAFSPIMGKVKFGHNPHVVTNRGVPSMVLLGVEDYEDMLKAATKRTKKTTHQDARAQEFDLWLDALKQKGKELGIGEYEDVLDLVDTIAEELSPKFQKELQESHEEYLRGEVGTKDDIEKILKAKMKYAE